jgi:hypothetical protein
MILITNKLIPKQVVIRISKITFLVILLAFGEKNFAQNSRIAIVNLVDSNLLYKHVGFSGFKDNTDTFDCQFNCKQYINQELSRILSARYTVSLMPVTNSLFQPNGDICNLVRNNKDAASWITNLKDQFDFVIFIETGEEVDLMDAKKQKLRSAGLYTRGNPAKSWVVVFSTCRFNAIRTSNADAVNYDLSGMEYLLPVTDYQFSRQNLLIDPEMLPLIKSSLIKLIDYKLQYFLTNSFLMPDGDYNK